MEDTKGFFLLYENDLGDRGKSRIYPTKEEMWENYDFLVQCGYTVRVKIA